MNSPDRVPDTTSSADCGTKKPDVLPENPHWLPKTPLVHAFIDPNWVNDGVMVKSWSPALEAHFPGAPLLPLAVAIALMRSRENIPGDGAWVRICMEVWGPIVPGDTLLVTPDKVHVSNLKDPQTPVITWSIRAAGEDVFRVTWDDQCRDLPLVSGILHQGTGFQFADPNQSRFAVIDGGRYFGGAYTVWAEWCLEDEEFDSALLPEVAAQMASAVAGQYFDNPEMVITFAKCDVTVFSVPLHPWDVITWEWTMHHVEGTSNHQAHITLTWPDDEIVLVWTVTWKPIEIGRLPTIAKLAWRIRR